MQSSRPHGVLGAAHRLATHQYRISPCESHFSWLAWAMWVSCTLLEGSAHGRLNAPSTVLKVLLVRELWPSAEGDNMHTCADQVPQGYPLISQD